MELEDAKRTDDRVGSWNEADMSEVADAPDQLQRFFRAALGNGDLAAEVENAKKLAAALGTDEAWLSSLRPTIDWLKTEPGLWGRATQLAAVYLDPRLATDPGPSASRLLLLSLFEASPEGAAAFVADIQNEQAVYRLARILPRLSLAPDVALALVGKCALVRGDGESPAAASELTEWASRNALQARTMVDARLNTKDGEAAFPVWGVEPLIEGAMKAPDGAIDAPEAWRSATIDALLASPNPRRYGLAAYLTCVAWPKPKPSASERHAAALALAHRSPAEMLPSILDAVMRDAWDEQEVTFSTLLRIVRLLEDAGLPYDVAIRVLRRVADVASRALGTLPVDHLPEALAALLPHLLAIPPSESARDHMLDFLLDGIFKRDRTRLESFLLTYLRAHAPRFWNSGLSFSEAFPLLTQSAGAGLVGTWLVAWMVDTNDTLRTCATVWAGNMENIRPSRAAIAALTPEQARAFVHVALFAPIRGATVFALMNAVMDTRDDVAELVQTVFVDELAVDYPGLTRRWVEETQSKGAAATPRSIEMAGLLQDRLALRDRLRAAHEQAPELYATSACFGAWMDIHQQIMATQAKEARKASVFAQLTSTFHVARGEAMSHSLSREPVPFVHTEFSYEQRVRVMLDPIGLQQIRLEHLNSARQLLACERPQ